MPPRVPAHFFFYGTLVAGHDHPVTRAIHACLAPVGPATVAGALFAIPDPDGWYPALVAGGSRVQGRVYAALPGFDTALLARMDAYEDCDPARADALYRRAPVEAVLADGTTLTADAYLWAGSLPPGALAIDGGDFSSWVAREGKAIFRPADHAGAQRRS